MKGVSPVVATVLMVAVAIAAAVVAYSWFMSMQASVQAEASRGAAEIGKYVINVDAVECNPTGNSITVYLRNTGKEAISSGSSYTIEVQTTDGSTLDVNTGTISGGLAAGEVTEIDATITGLTAGETYVAYITVEGGAKASKQFTC